MKLRNTSSPKLEVEICRLENSWQTLLRGRINRPIEFSEIKNKNSRNSISIDKELLVMIWEWEEGD